MIDPETQQFLDAKGPFHDVRLHVANVCHRVHLENPDKPKNWRDTEPGPNSLLLPHRLQREVMIADALIQLCELAAWAKCDLGGTVAELLEYYRFYRRLAARAAAPAELLEYYRFYRRLAARAAAPAENP